MPPDATPTRRRSRPATQARPADAQTELVELVRRAIADPATPEAVRGWLRKLLRGDGRGT